MSTLAESLSTRGRACVGGFAEALPTIGRVCIPEIDVLVVKFKATLTDVQIRLKAALTRVTPQPTATLTKALPTLKVKLIAQARLKVTLGDSRRLKASLTEATVPVALSATLVDVTAELKIGIRQATPIIFKATLTDVIAELNAGLAPAGRLKVTLTPTVERLKIALGDC